MTSPAAEGWGQYIRRKRYEMAAQRGERVTQPDLAAMLKKAPITVYCWEKRGQVPPPAEQDKIRQILGA